MMTQRLELHDDVRPIVAVIDWFHPWMWLSVAFAAAAIGLACGSFVLLTLAIISAAGTPIGCSWLLASPSTIFCLGSLD